MPDPHAPTPPPGAADATAGLARMAAAARGNDSGIVLRERDGEVWLSIRNEFAMVELTIESDVNGPRVRLRDAESGDSITLDPLELEALTRARHSQFGRLILER